MRAIGRMRRWLSGRASARTPAELGVVGAIGVCTAAAAGVGPTVLTEWLSDGWLLVAFVVAAAALVVLIIVRDGLERRRGDIAIVCARHATGARWRLWREDDREDALREGRARYLNAHDVTFTLPTRATDWSPFPHRIAGAVAFIKGSAGIRGDLRGITPLGSLTVLFATGVAMGHAGEFERVVPFDTDRRVLVPPPLPLPSDEDSAPTANGSQVLTEVAIHDDEPNGIVGLIVDLTARPVDDAATVELAEHGCRRIVRVGFPTGKTAVDLATDESTLIADEFAAHLSKALDHCTELHVVVAAPAFLALSLGLVLGGQLPSDRPCDLWLHEWRPGASRYDPWQVGL